MIWTLLAGCAPLWSLSDVPIEGGTAAQRDQAREVLSWMEQEIGSGRVALRGVEIAPDDKAIGRYQHGTRRIWLDSESYLPTAIRHEVCHALVDQDDLLDTPMAAIDAFFERLPTEWTAHLKSERKRRSEAIALACEWGPIGAEAIADLGCVTDLPAGLDPDADLRRRVGEWLLANVWAAHAFTEPVSLALAPVGSWTPRDVGHIEGVSPTSDPDVIAIFREGVPEYAGLYGQPFTRPASIEESERDIPPGLAGLYAPSSGFAGWEAGPAAAVGNWIPEPLAVVTPPSFFVFEDGEWRSVNDGCSLGAQWLFTIEDALWTAWMEPTGEVAWCALGVR